MSRDWPVPPPIWDEVEDKTPEAVEEWLGARQQYEEKLRSWVEEFMRPSIKL